MYLFYSIAAQGASYVQRKLASSMTMIHTITMDPELTVIRIQVNYSELLFM